MMTEQEAKTKWCPAARQINVKPIDDKGTIAVQSGVPTHNRIKIEGEDAPGFPKAAACIGSACMAWRWTYGVPGSVTVQAGQVVAPLERTGGYCGLAGRPNE